MARFQLVRSMQTLLATLNVAGRNYPTGATVALHPVYLGKLINFPLSGFTGEIQRTSFSSFSFLYESPKTIAPQPIQATNFRYCSDKKYPVKLTGATIALHPVYGGKLMTIHLSGFTAQTISGGRIEVDVSVEGFPILSEKFNLHDVTSGSFVIPFISENVLEPFQGIYSFKLKLLSNDGHELSCVAFDFPIHDPGYISDP